MKLILTLIFTSIFSTQVYGQTLVYEIQSLLSNLGYSVGIIDGAYGSKTRTALENFYKDNNKEFDGEVSTNELSDLRKLDKVSATSQANKNQSSLTQRHRSQKININTDHKVSEVALIDAKDINNDGVDDFVVGFMTDPTSQLGIECCEVPKSRLNELEKLPIYAVISGPKGYQVSKIPGSNTHRTWAGKFFEINNVTYFYLGRNGEIGLPQENAGEKSVLYKILNEADQTSFEKIWEAKRPTVTSSVSVKVLGSKAYILENNYGLDSIKKFPTSVYDSVLYLFNGLNGELSGIELRNRLKSKAADNHLRLVDYDSDGKMDLLAASEVWKSLDGKNLETSWPGSYVVNNIAANSSQIRLAPAAFEDNHAGMAIALIKNSENTVIVEASTAFFGHQGGGFKGAKLMAYVVEQGMKQTKVVGQLNSSKGTFRDLHQFISNGEMYLVPGYYSGRPQVISLIQGAEIKVSNLSIRGYDQAGSGGASAIIPLLMNGCISFATTKVNLKSNSVKIQTSSCLN